MILWMLLTAKYLCIFHRQKVHDHYNLRLAISLMAYGILGVLNKLKKFETLLLLPL